MTGIIQSMKGDAERCTEIRDIAVPDLWHIAHEYPDGTLHKAAILECWHLAHDMKTVLVALDKVIPLMLQRATERIKELITDIQEMGDVDQRTIMNLKCWASELADYTGLFEYLPMGGDFMGSERNEAEHYIALALKLAEEIEEEIGDE